MEHTGYRSGRVRIVGAEPAGRSAAMRSEEDAPTSWEPTDWDDDDNIERDEDPPPESLVPPLPHWTEPATGEVPAILSSEPEAEDADPFASLPGPTWREEGADWDAQDEDFEPSMLAGDRTGQGSLDTGPSDRQPWVFDLPGSGSSARRIFGDAQEWDDDNGTWDDLIKNVPAPSWVSEADDEGPITEVMPVVAEDREVPFEAAAPAASPLSPEVSVPDEPVLIDDVDDPIAEPRSRFRSLRSERRPTAASTPGRRPP
ncbi:MAG TPA: hypothetical protein VEJ44_05080, partial [Acidimicrobiales bacterium]|nr:hypothetical protein [Acidimicrobiales bacterium]